MVPFFRLLTALPDVLDPRRSQGKRYPLARLLLFTVLALLSGARSYRGIATFLEHRRILLNDLFGMDLKRAPALNTLGNVLQAVGPEALEGVFLDHAKDLLVEPKEDKVQTIALDGKVLRGSFEHLNDKKAAQAMMAFASPAAIVLAHTEIAETQPRSAA